MIREKSIEGKSPYAIGKELGISKNTVKKYLTSGDETPCYPKRGSKLDPFKVIVDDMMSRGIFNCVVIMEKICELGYNGKISILKEYVHPHRPPKGPPAVQRYETMPGQQAQMDWGLCHYVDLDGVSHKVPAFTMILGRSRTKYVEFTKRCDLFSLEKCILNALEYFGGVPKIILTDNMKTVVIGREAGKPIWNPSFLDFANDIGFVPKVCKVRRPETKGKVERLVHYVKDNFMPGKTFTDIEDLNRQVLAWCDKVNAKPLAMTGKTALQTLKEEYLIPLPNATITDRYRYESRLASKDGFVSYDGVRYGVPWEYSGKQLTVRAKSGKLEIFDGLQVIATHELEAHSGRLIFLPGQYVGLAEKHGLTYTSGAKQIEPIVEERSLSVYEGLLEVSNG